MRLLMLFAIPKKHPFNERFRDANSSYSGYKSEHAHKSTRVMQSRASRVINNLAASYGY